MVVVQAQVVKKYPPAVVLIENETGENDYCNKDGDYGAPNPFLNDDLSSDEEEASLPHRSTGHSRCKQDTPPPAAAATTTTTTTTTATTAAAATTTATTTATAPAVNPNHNYNPNP